MQIEPKFKRCIFVSQETGGECETWFEPKSVGQELCPIHVGAVNVTLAANGTNKDPYIAKRNDAMLSVAECIRGLGTNEAMNLIDQHIATIEQAIEDQKIQALAWRGKRGEVLDSLSETERAARRKIQTPKLARAKKENAGKDLGKALIEREKAIKSMMALGHSRERAIALLEME